MIYRLYISLGVLIIINGKFARIQVDYCETGITCCCHQFMLIVSDLISKLSVTIIFCTTFVRRFRDHTNDEIELATYGLVTNAF